MNADGPSRNGPNGGRDAQGQFAKGWKGGPGNPHAKKVGQLRSALLDAVTVEDMRAIVRKLIELAKAGNIQAAREVLDRCLGKSGRPGFIEDLEERKDSIRLGDTIL